MKNRIPGDLNDKDYISQIIRVNHAGEYGAKRIYQGQLDILKKTKSAFIIKHMAEQEEEHLKYFEDKIVERRVRPTILFPLWHIAGYILGASTALMGEKAAMACTEAVETVIDEHYQDQLTKLKEDEKELREKINQFREEELEHKNIAESSYSKEAPAYKALTGLIKIGCKTAIWLSKRI